ncbi:MAG: HAD family hydrolase [Candidatus Acetothermia bacterium]
MRTEIISFDADGTVVNNDFVNEFWFKKLPELYANKEGIGTGEAREILTSHYDRIGDEDLRWYQPRYWFDRFDLPGTAEEVITQIKENHDLRLYDDAVEVIEGLSGEYRLIVVSNSPREFLDFSLKRVSDRFERIFSCVSDFGEVKKHRGVYEKVADLLSAQPGMFLHVGDHWKFDYQVPREIGMKTAFIDRGHGEVEDRDDGVITDLREITKVLEGSST